MQEPKEKHQRLHTDREPPPYFAGRRDELAALNRRLDALIETRNASGGIALVTGVPGAGKTQLAVEFASRAQERDSAADIKVRTVHVTSLERETDLMLEIGAALAEQAAAEKVVGLAPKVAGGNAGAFGVRGGVTIDHARHTGGMARLLAASADAGMWQEKVLVVVIDELQSIHPDGMAPLRVLHQGVPGCPMLVLGVGLQHTAEVLARPGRDVPGISRLANPIALQPLASAEAEEAIGGGMEVLGCPIADAEAVRRIAEATFGFPQHVHGHLKAAEDVYRERGGLNGEDALREALRRGSEARERYYKARLDAMGGRDAYHMVAVAVRMQDAGAEELPWPEAEAALEAAAPGRGQALVESAVAHGVLTKGAQSGMLGFGIPSFHNHMVRLAEERAAYRRRRASGS